MQKAIRETSTGVRFTAAKYTEISDSKWKFASLDKVLDGNAGENITLGALIEDDKNPEPYDVVFTKETERQLQEAMAASLDEKEQKVIIMRFGLKNGKTMSLSEVGKEMGYTKERIRQIEAKGLNHLRASCRSLGKDLFDNIAA